MSTGQASSSFFAMSASSRTSSATSTSMNVPGISLRLHLLADLLFHEVRDLADLLRHGDPGVVQALDLLRGGVGLALDDRAGVAEAHARHLVHEASRHEGDDRELRAGLRHV